MHVIEWPMDVASLLNRFESVGGCVNFVHIDPDNIDPSLESTARGAAILAVESIGARYARPPSLWRPTIDYARANVMAGNIITPVSFMGSRWHRDRQSLIVQQQVLHRHISRWFCAREVPAEANALPDSGEHTGNTGYAYAFTDPPYGLQIRGATVQDLFDAINGALLPDLFSRDTVVWQWPTDWSNYFDAGSEWWGSFLWTVMQRHRPIVCIAESTTD